MKKLFALCVSLAAACGGAQEPPGDTQTLPGAADPPAAAAQQVEEASGVMAQSAESDLAQAEAPPPPARTQFQLGRHYQRLSPTQPTSSSPEEIEVAEVFWYGCPHCYTFEPYLERWREEKPGYVSFVRIPAVWNELLRVHARAYYTAEALDMVETLHSEIFRAIHVDGNPLDSPAALRQFFARFGVDAESFDRAFDSFAVHTRLQRADELARRYRVASVPLVVINGKYTTDANSAGGYDRLIEVIDELVAMETARAQ